MAKPRVRVPPRNSTDPEPMGIGGRRRSKQVKVKRPSGVRVSPQIVPPPPSEAIRVVIFTYERPKHLTRALQDILAFRGAHRVSVVVYDDASTADYSEPKAILQNQGWEYVRADQRHGKRKFWKWVSRAYGEQKVRSEPYFVLLPDDMRLCQQFFDRALSTWHSIRDSKKVSLCLMRDSGRDGNPCWTPIRPVDKGIVEQIGWVDGAIFCQHQYFNTLGWKVPSVPASRWQNDPTLSTGVGQKLSVTLHGLGAHMYGVKESLLAHVAGASTMNPKARKENPLQALQFADGDGVHRGLLDPEPVWVSLASVSRRAGMLRRVVDALYSQCDRLNVYLNDYRRVPKFLNRPKIVVARSQDHGDRGDAGKFFWAAEVPGYHLTVDDDIAYPANYVQTLVRRIDHYDRNAVVGVHGVVLAKEVGESYYNSRHVYRCLGSLKRDTAVHILGTGVAGYHKSGIQLTPSTFRVKNMADIWLGIAAKKQDVPMVCIKHGAGWVRDLGDPNVEDSIWGRARFHDHVQAKHLRRAGPWTPPLEVPGAARSLERPASGFAIANPGSSKKRRGQQPSPEVAAGFKPRKPTSIREKRRAQGKKVL